MYSIFYYFSCVQIHLVSSLLRFFVRLQYFQLVSFFRTSHIYLLFCQVCFFLNPLFKLFFLFFFYQFYILCFNSFVVSVMKKMHGQQRSIQKTSKVQLAALCIGQKREEFLKFEIRQEGFQNVSAILLFEFFSFPTLTQFHRNKNCFLPFQKENDVLTLFFAFSHFQA